MDTQTPSRSLLDRLRARPALTGGLGLALLAILAVVVFWFEPQALFIDDVVDEEFPTVEPEAAAGDAEAEQPEEGDASGEGDTATASGEDDAAAATDDATGTTDDAAATTEETAGSDPEAGEGDGGAQPEDAGDGAAPEEPAGPVALATGSFEGRNDYAVAGEATFYELADGSRTLRFEDLEADNGPDLYVYLTSASGSDSDGAITDDFIDLGVLKGNIGSQNYELPADVDLERYDTVVIWCLRFNVGFGTADLVAS